MKIKLLIILFALSVFPTNADVSQTKTEQNQSSEAASVSTSPEQTTVKADPKPTTITTNATTDTTAKTPAINPEDAKALPQATDTTTKSVSTTQATPGTPPEASVDKTKTPPEHSKESPQKEIKPGAATNKSNDQQAIKKPETSIEKEPKTTQPIKKDPEKKEPKAKAPKIPKKTPSKKGEEKKRKISRKRLQKGEIDFTFDNDNLTTAIKRYAEAAKMNIILPASQSSDAIKQKITFNPPHPLSINEAKKYLYFFLDMAGYTIRPGASNSYQVKTDIGGNIVRPSEEFWVVTKVKEVGTDPLHFYVNIGARDIPNTDEYIRSVYYLDNLKIDEKSPVYVLLKDMISDPANIIADPISGALIITDKARLVKSAIEILDELDGIGVRNIIISIQLYNANASTVADLIKTQILGSKQQNGMGGSSDVATGVTGTYFSNNIRVVADDRRNTLIIMGKEAPANRLKEFVQQYLDAPLQSGMSLFHVYDLKYHDADNLKEVLNNLINPSSGNPQVGSKALGGTRRTFEGVIIESEKWEPVKTVDQTNQQQPPQDSDPLTASGQVYTGGNRLLIAATPSDWLQLKKLIDKLDRPQRQVILEVMVIDYTRIPTKQIVSQVRNPTRFDFKEGVGFQSANMPNTGIVTRPAFPATDAQSIVSDLLAYINDMNDTIISPLAPGSFVISFDDPANTGIWSLLSILDTMGHTKVISHPHLVVLDHAEGKVYSSVVKRGAGDANPAVGVVVQNIVDIDASISVQVTPRISSYDRLNLELIIGITQFTTAAADNFTRVTRNLSTNVNMGSPNQILVLGGLTRTVSREATSEVPILGQIPILGWLFRSTRTVVEQSELGIFVRPTIVDPKIQDVSNAYTDAKIHSAVSEVEKYEEGALGNQEDPIVRLFFGAGSRSKESVVEYLQEANALERNKYLGKRYSGTDLPPRPKWCKKEIFPSDTENDNAYHNAAA